MSRTFARTVRLGLRMSVAHQLAEETLKALVADGMPDYEVEPASKLVEAITAALGPFEDAIHSGPDTFLSFGTEPLGRKTAWSGFCILRQEMFAGASLVEDDSSSVTVISRHGVRMTLMSA